MHKERKWRMYLITAWLAVMLLGTFINVDYVRGMTASFNGYKQVAGEASIIDKIPDGLLHAGGFFVLAILSYRPGKKSARTIAVLVAFAVLLEVIQPLSGVRFFQMSDIPYNLLGLSLGAGLMEFVHFPRSPKKSETKAMAPVRS